MARNKSNANNKPSKSNANTDGPITVEGDQKLHKPTRGLTKM